MTKLYLITGFLGSGKTTFIKQIARVFDGQKLSILVNEFGKEDVDSVLLKELKARIEEIHNGSIFCICRLEQFEQALIELTAENSDIILVETSGLSDPTNIQRILSDRQKFGNVLYMGGICVADAVNFMKVYTTAMACKKQLEASSLVVLNKSDLVDSTKPVRQFIEQQHPGVPVLETSFGLIPPEWADAIRQPVPVSGVPTMQKKDITIQSYLLTIRDTFPVESFIEFLNSFAGETYRIKGFVHLEGQFYFVDCVGDKVSVTICEFEGMSNRVVVLAGQGMKTWPALQRAMEIAAEYIVSVE